VPAEAAAPTEAPAELPFLVSPEEAREGTETHGAGVPLAAAYTSLARLTAERSMPPGALDELFSAPAEQDIVPIEALAPTAPAEHDVVPIEALAPTPLPVEEEVPVEPIQWLEPEEPEPEAEALPAADADVVPIESLLYGGTAALERALALQPEIEALLAARNGGAAQVAALLHEVFDLVQLGLGAAH